MEGSGAAPPPEGGVGKGEKAVGCVSVGCDKFPSHIGSTSVFTDVSRLAQLPYLTLPYLK